MIDLTFQLLLSRGDFFPQKILYYYYKIKEILYIIVIFLKSLFLLGVAIVITPAGHKESSYATGCSNK